MSSPATISVTFPGSETRRVMVSFLTKEMETPKDVKMSKEVMMPKEVISSTEMMVLPSVSLPSSSLSTLTALPVPENTQARAILFASPELPQVWRGSKKWRKEIDSDFKYKDFFGDLYLS